MQVRPPGHKVQDAGRPSAPMQDAGSRMQGCHPPGSVNQLCIKLIVREIFFDGLVFSFNTLDKSVERTA